jgi:arsenate reductase
LRNVLAMIRASGIEPDITAYPTSPPDAETLARVAGRVGGARALLRVKGTPAAEPGLDSPAASDPAILAAMAEHPIRINRPVVFGPKGVVLARPSEKALDVLDGGLPAGFSKQAGAPVGAA